MAWVTPILHSVGDVLSASDWNISSNDLTFLYGDSAWTAPSVFTNGWAQNTEVVGYRKVNSLVTMRGGVSAGTTGLSAFTLPVGYRPGQTVTFIVWDATGSTGVFLQVTTAGLVVIGVGTHLVYLDQVIFQAEN